MLRFEFEFVPKKFFVRSASVLAFAAVLGLTSFSMPLVAGGADKVAKRPFVRVQGSTTFHANILKPNISQIEERAGVTVNVIPNKSIWGVIALLERRADIAMISTRLAAEIDVVKRTAGEQPYDRLQEHNVAKTRIAFAVHPTNPVRILSFDQVRNILLGEIRNWQDVGGVDMPIRIVAVHDGSGTVDAVSKQMLSDKALSHDGTIRIKSAKHLIKIVQEVPGAIGIAQLDLVKEAKLPEIETDRHVQQSLNLITFGDPTAQAQLFINAVRGVIRTNAAGE